jgi:ankyrin repeat protein
MPIIVKCGSYHLSGEGRVEFITNSGMLEHMSNLVNVDKAETSIASDRKCILSSIKKDNEGEIELNSIIRRCIRSAWVFSKSTNGGLISCGACGDREARELAVGNHDSIFDVATGGFIHLLRALIEGGADLNAVQNGFSVLMLCCKGGHVDCVQYLVEQNVLNVNAVNNGGSTALMLACTEDHIDCMRLLVEQRFSRVDIGAMNDNGHSALILASDRGHVECVKYLIQRGADVNSVDRLNEYSALVFAARKGHFYCMKYLVEKGAKVNARDKMFGKTALMEAAEGGNYFINNFYRILYIYVLNMHYIAGHLDCVRYLVEQGADVAVVTKARYTAQILASLRSHTEVVEYLKLVQMEL